ncbi:hypothetical protein [Deinococcus yavapaiensis]|uniref:Lipoprotein n=1 Tax=Deinococcus yavapaiensis KR-236 TaxID=694435 RepID=A0A318SJ41_9DEIO|nr:hypothetical protein [Deinococcus yavapaiensis]PYE54205.1 hypothetical protein DES52_106171 [Deinococcus yavapaiensis KR-236]
MKRILALMTLPLLLAACTGTVEELPSIRLVIADGARTLRSVNSQSPSTSPVTVTTTSDVVGLTSAQSGTRVAVAFPDRVELRDANLVVASTIAAPSGFTPCFSGLRGDENGSRLALLSSCTNNTQQNVLLYSPNGDLIFNQQLPLPSYDPSTIRFDVSADAVFLARPTISGGGEVLRVTATGTTTLLTTPSPIEDLVVRGATVFVSTSGSVTPINAAASPPALGTPLLTLDAERLFSNGNLLVAFDADTSNGTVSVTNDGAVTARVPFTPALQDATVAPDSYLYLLQRTGLARVDVVRLVESPTRNYLGVNVTDGRFLAWIVSDAATASASRTIEP